LSLPHLLTRKTKEKEQLVNHMKSHVIISLNEYLKILSKRKMEKEVVEEISKNEQKENEFCNMF
jgi:hypothetical protein